MTAGFVGVILPPDHAVTAGFILGGRAAGSREADIQRLLADGDIRIAAVEDDASLFVLIESQMNEAAQVIAGLRVPLANDPLNLVAQKISGAGRVFGLVAQERIQIASGRESDSVNFGVLRSV